MGIWAWNLLPNLPNAHFRKFLSLLYYIRRTIVWHFLWVGAVGGEIKFTINYFYLKGKERKIVETLRKKFDWENIL